MTPAFSRRRALRSSLALAGAALSLPSCTALTRGFFAPERPTTPLVGTRAFVRRMFEGLDRRRVWDSHLHVLGDGKSGTGCWVNPRFYSYPGRFLYDMYLGSGGVPDTPDAEQRYVDLFVKLHTLMNDDGRVLALAFDYAVREDGTVDESVSEFYTPNTWVKQIADRHRSVLPVGSIHPYRADAVDTLDALVEQGFVGIKWLPNAQRIDTTSPRCDRFFDRLAHHELPLIVHAGHEAAAESEGGQAFGNVLRLRRALDRGVRVVVAHCAGLGEDEDIDAKEGERRVMESYDLFRRLMGEKQYEGRLFADISAMTQVNRAFRPLRETIVDTELHPRLVNGSDFPLPAVRGLVSAFFLEKLGYLTRDDRIHCERIARKNALLYDFCVKRALTVDDGQTLHRFSDEVFESARVFAHLPAVKAILPRAT